MLSATTAEAILKKHSDISVNSLPEKKESLDQCGTGTKSMMNDDKILKDKNDLKLKRLSMSTPAEESSCNSESDVTHEQKLKRLKSEEPSNTEPEEKKDVHLKSYRNIEKPNSQEKTIDNNLKMKIIKNNVNIKKKVAENSEISRDAKKSAAKSGIKDEERVPLDVNITNKADVEDSKSTLPPFKVELNLKKEINGSDGDESLRKPSGGNVKCHLGTCDCEYKPMNLDTEKKIRTFFSGLNDGSLNVNMDVLEAIIGRVFVDRLCNKSEMGSKRLENLALKEEHKRLRIAFNELKKQVEFSTIIIKKMIQERNRRGAFRIVPLRVTRSVGLQVCTVGEQTCGVSEINTINSKNSTSTPSTSGNKINSLALTPLTSGINTNSKSAASTSSTSGNKINSLALTPSTATTDIARFVAKVIDLTADDSNTGEHTQIEVQPAQPTQSFQSRTPEALRSLPSEPRAFTHLPHISKLPKPVLRIRKDSTGINLMWNIEEQSSINTITKYQIYAYKSGTSLDVSSWLKVGDIDAKPLPMGCTITELEEGLKYFFVVRAMDVNMKLGDFSLPISASAP